MKKNLTEIEKAIIIFEHFEDFINKYYKEVYFKEKQDVTFPRKIAKCLDLSSRTVLIWFSNRNINVLNSKNKNRINSLFQLDPWIWQDKAYDCEVFKNRIKEYNIR